MFDDVNNALLEKKNDKAIEKIVIETGYNKFVQLANQLEVSDYVKAKVAVDMIIQLKDICKNIELQRKDFVKNIMKRKTNVNNKSKDLINHLNEIEKTIRDKLDVYYKSVKETVSPQLFLSQSKIEATEGTATTKEVWKWELEDKRNIPREYLMIDEKALDKAIKSGIRHIEGIRIYSEQETKFRKRNGEQNGK